VDFLRAVSILAVVLGHWTAAAPYVDAEGTLTPTHVLAVSPWTHWLTWAIQVMPIFFLVGGYSNGTSWSAARRDGKTYADWLDARLSRLVGPVLPLLAVWVLIGVVAHGRVRPEMVRVGSQMALIPTWFLAVYVGVAVFVPLTHALWRRFGLASFWGLAGCAALVDVLFFAAGLHAFAWVNYFFVWTAVHQLGYAWRDGWPGGAGRALVWGAGGLALLLALTHFGPYPVAMVGVPGDAVSNTTPPKVTLLALGAFQAGLLLALESVGRRWLARPRPWTATVLVNGHIMTVYLWHLTAMVLVIGLLFALGGVGMTRAPGSAAWWSFRPVWLAGLALALLPFVAAFGRFERPHPRAGPPPPAWRLVLGAAAVCTGLALLALDGIAGDGWLGLRAWVLALPFAGALLARHT